METEKYILAVDIGTTSTKAIIFNQNGQLISKSSYGYSMHTPQPAWSEQDPDEIFEAVIQSMKDSIEKSGISRKDLVGVTFSSAMHSLIAMDENGNNLTQCITWADNRSAAYTEKLKEEWNGYSIYQRTGTPLHPMAPLSKILWFKYENKEIYEKTAKWISIKEYVFYQFFGEYIVDYSIASATGLFNLRELDWDQEVMRLLGLTKNHLSQPVQTTYQVTGLKKKWQEYLGFDKSLPFVIGASDGVLANLGVGAIDPRITAISIGTSGAVRKVTRKPVTDERGRTFCYVLAEDLWVIGGAINNGGLVFQWIKDHLANCEAEEAQKKGIDSYEYLLKMADEVQPGSEGLIFMPYLTGERAPYFDAHARGVFFGLSIHHQKRHMIRSALEGVIYQLYNVFQIIEELTEPSVEVKANGGFARSTLWSQMMADVFSVKVKIPEIYESSAYGAAKLGFYSLGILSSLIDSDDSSSMKEFEPIKENSRVYQELIEIFIRLYLHLHSEFKQIVKHQ